MLLACLFSWRRNLVSCDLSCFSNIPRLINIVDNMGSHKEYIHPDTIENVTKRYPRREWSKCFSSKLREEIGLKPWCHTTVNGEMFPHNIEHNALMEPYDKLY